METEDRASFAARARRVIVGEARDPHDPTMFHKLSLIAFFAWVGLGADGLSSSCYGPPEAFQVLAAHPHLAVLVALATAFTIIIIGTAYAQIIELFPTGGGGYVVASHLISPEVGMVSGCALLIDYVLTISLSISSGADAIFSFLPPSWMPARFWFAVGSVLLLIALNMRGVKESVLPILPIFLFFVVSHAFAIAYALFAHAGHVVDIPRQTWSEAHAVASQTGVFGLFFVIMHAYSMGAGTYTGIEAVSNGLPILRDPKVRTGKRTMLYMGASLIFMVLGLMLAYILTGAAAVEGKTLNAVMLERISAAWNPQVGHAFVWLTLFSEGAILLVAAQTGFLDGPRVLSNMALDRWFPNRFAMLSDRLVTQNGVLLMGGAALATIVLSNASAGYLLVLYSITVFITFVLSQLGMLRHWWKVRGGSAPWKRGMAINGFGMVLTLFILVSMIATKFMAGGWITILVTGGLVFLAVMVRRHYEHTRKLLRRLDSLVEVTKAAVEAMPPGSVAAPACDPEAKTAIVLVNGFNGLGLHTLFSIVRTFGGAFKQYVFLQVGAVDAGNFKGAEELQRLQRHIDSELAKYVAYMNAEGYYAESRSVVGTDIVEEIAKLSKEVLPCFPQGVFFGGQLVFPEDTVFTRLLHNYIVFAVQRRLYSRGIPFMILPIRV